jgi:hypothetical protein
MKVKQPMGVAFQICILLGIITSLALLGEGAVWFYNIILKPVLK